MLMHFRALSSGSVPITQAENSIRIGTYTGTAIALSTATGNTLQVVGPFIGRWNKGVTGGSVGLTKFDDWVST